MIPIFEQGDGQGIGHNLDSFLERFDKICEEHIQSAKAHWIAFLFYDFRDQSLKRILRDKGVFTQLDRLSGTELSLFYLHANTRRATEAFNKTLMSAVSQNESVELPCLVFCQIKNGEFDNVSIIHLENQNLIHGFHELYNVISQKISAKPENNSPPSRWRPVGSGAKFLSLEAFRAFLRQAIQLIM